jgi:putative hydrolase of the HAD superfamily
MTGRGQRRALVFDVGDVLTRPGFELFDQLEMVIGRRIEGRGPLAAGGDPRWQRLVDGELSSTEYWNGVAESAGVADWRRLYELITIHFPVEMWDPSMLQLADEAKAMGYRIGVLTNDMVAISGPGWAATNRALDRFDAIVDATELGVRKPAPQAYAAICAALDVQPEHVVFLDDTPACVDGAIASGMRAVLVDTFDRGPALAATRELLNRAA